MKRFLLVIVVMTMLVYAKPMESIERYNIILVHGAADSLSGVDCEASDLKAPFEYYTDSTSDFGRIDGYLKEGLLDDSRSTATGMIKTLPDWINDNILDGERKDRFGIYLNRPFVNPANTISRKQKMTCEFLFRWWGKSCPPVILEAERRGSIQF